MAQFQSTRPRGARLDFNDGMDYNGKVSIHAPARGATVGDAGSVADRLGFNPRARAGRDSMARPAGSVPDGFNPRARAGRDAPNGCWNWIGNVSIHAPARGATVQDNIDDREHKFQSTRPRGARPAIVSDRLRLEFVSIHAPARGATRG
mgnify:CR=1 FL=1